MAKSQQRVVMDKLSSSAICSKYCNFMEEVLIENSTPTKFKTINDFQWNLTHAEIPWSFETNITS